MANLSHIVGLEGVLERMAELPKQAAMQINRGAANAMATKIRQQAVYLAPVYEGDKKGPAPGRLRDAIIQKHLPELSGTYRQTYLVTVRRGQKPEKEGGGVVVRGGKVVDLDAYYWPWVEFGHWFVPPRPKGITRKAHRERAKEGAGAVWIQPRSFLRPALPLASDEAVKAAENYYKKWLDRWVLTDTGWTKVKRAA
ncbi:HK97 family phage protein [Burkholderia pseudomallei]|nr:HK97 family phage protein [Burkholderia pseudomallei]